MVENDANCFSERAETSHRTRCHKLRTGTDCQQCWLLAFPGITCKSEKGRKIARKRARLMLAYLRQLAKEMDTELPDHWAALLK